MKIGRNAPCPCGGGKKFKKCHGAVRSDEAADGSASSDFQQLQRRRRAAQQIRRNQQGLGRPIVGAIVQGHQVVAVGNRLFASAKWQTVTDFLGDYLKTTLGPDWGNAEIQKSLGDRHPIMQWYDAFCRYQAKHIPKPGTLTETDVTGVVACYVGLAYSLYLLAHNVELQDRLVRRLRDPSNFQGAYYELIVANALIRAGFTLALEDEADSSSKHCEFAAISKHTGKRYWVEAKMRGVAGYLGRTAQDGTKSQDPLSSLTRQLTAAFKKPATDERIIFIDLNTEYDPATRDKPAWVASVNTALERYERDLPDAKAYVVVTNTPFHRMLEEPAPLMALPYGLNMPDFNRPGFYRMSEAYKNKRKHLDAYEICDAFANYLSFPATFDGSLPSETFGDAPARIMVGEKYHFEDAGLTGVVTTATVVEEEKKVYIGVTREDGRAVILSEPMIDAALADYRKNRDTYFGEVRPAGRSITDPYEFFEWVMQVNASLSRDLLMQRLHPHFSRGALDALPDDELRALYCEGLCAAVERQSKKRKGAANSSGKATS